MKPYGVLTNKLCALVKAIDTHSGGSDEFGVHRPSRSLSHLCISMSPNGACISSFLFAPKEEACVPLLKLRVPLLLLRITHTLDINSIQSFLILRHFSFSRNSISWAIPHAQVTPTVTKTNKTKPVKCMIALLPYCSCLKLLEHGVDSHHQYISTGHSLTNPRASTPTAPIKMAFLMVPIDVLIAKSKR